MIFTADIISWEDNKFKKISTEDIFSGLSNFFLEKEKHIFNNYTVPDVDNVEYQELFGYENYYTWENMNYEKVMEYIMESKKIIKKECRFNSLEEVDVIKIHQYIIHKLYEEKNEYIKIITEKLENEKNIISKQQSGVDRKYSLNIIQKYNYYMNEVITEKNIKEYINKTKDIIIEFLQLGPVKFNLFFNLYKYIVKHDSVEKIERRALINQYICIASQYITIKVLENDEFDNNCVWCGDCLDDVDFDENGIKTCPNCGLSKMFISRETNDGNDIDGKVSKDYVDKDNFVRAFNQYACNYKLPDYIMEEISKGLDEYFIEAGINTGDYYKAQLLNAQGKKDNTSKTMMYSALKHVKKRLSKKMGQYTSHYKDATLICVNYWGWAVPDVWHLKDIIMKDYDDTQRVYNRIKHTIHRKSSLNVQYRLYMHLVARGHKCKTDDFKIIKTKETLKTYEEIWRIMANECALKYEPII